MRLFVSPIMIVVLMLVTFVAHGTQPLSTSAATVRDSVPQAPCNSLLRLECRYPQQRPPYVLDGETLFRGLFFGRGPVASRFPEITSAFPAVPAEAEGAVNEFIARVSNRLRQRDWRYFDRLAAGLQSGDHVSIANTMDYAARMLQAVLEEEIGTYRSVLIAQTEGPAEFSLDGASATATVSASAGGPATATNEGDGVFIAAAAVVAAAVAAVVVVAGAFAAVVNTAAVFNQVALWHGPGGASTELQREYWVNVIAERLPHKPVADMSLLRFPVAQAKPLRPLAAQIDGGLELAINALSDGTAAASASNSNGPGDIIAINLDHDMATLLFPAIITVVDQPFTPAIVLPGPPVLAR